MAPRAIAARRHWSRSLSEDHQMAARRQECRRAAALLSGQGQNRAWAENAGASARRSRTRRAAARAGTISDAVLRADTQTELSRRSSQASPGHGAFSGDDGALPKSRALAERHGAGTAQ